jgi:hypothetical protein
VWQNLKGYRPAALRRMYRWLRWKMRWLLRVLEPNRAMRRRIFSEFFDLDLSRRAVVPEFLAYFLFEPYDEEEIKRFLERQETGYRRPSDDALLGHADCEIHDACGYLYQLQHGVGRAGLEVAMMRRSGLIDATQAEEILSRNVPREDRLEASIERLLSALDVTHREFEELTRRLGSREAPPPLG